MTPVRPAKTVASCYSGVILAKITIEGTILSAMSAVSKTVEERQTISKSGIPIA